MYKEINNIVCKSEQTPIIHLNSDPITLPGCLDFSIFFILFFLSQKTCTKFIIRYRRNGNDKIRPGDVFIDLLDNCSSVFGERNKDFGQSKYTNI